ncbi:hypothetical protein ABMA27_010437 [Loxostege sticticalis]|uniref:Integrase catalytic domain-containing protein n=1 Tax=Loxostege sticticalis TaxID=481309 RepID=A0ABR3H6B5_LOXSC
MSDIEPGQQNTSEKPDIVNPNELTIELQKYYSRHNENSKKLEWTNQRIQSIIKLLDEYSIIKFQGRRPTNKHYHHARKYDVMNIGNQKVLLVKRKNISDPVLQIIPTEEYYEKIFDAHIATGHGRRDKIVYALKDKYVVPIFAYMGFPHWPLCKTCLSRKTFPKKGIVVKPMVSDDFNRGGQIDLVDFQTSPDQEYKWLLQYQDHLTKLCFLRPLNSKQAKEVAIEMLKIFLEVGCPHILQNDNGREFTASVLKEIVSLWPACKPRYPQSQGSIERSNQDIKNMIRAWMTDSKSTNWSIGCYFVQIQNSGLSSTYLSKNIISKLENEEDVEKLLEEINNNKEQNSEKIKRMKRKTQEETKITSHEIIIKDIANDPELLPVLHANLPVTKDAINVLDNKQDNISYHSTNSKDSKEQGKPNEHMDKEIITLEKSTAPSELPFVSDIGNHPVLIPTCTDCKKNVHVICGVAPEETEGYGSQLLCNLCVNERKIRQMLSMSTKKFKDISTGSTVLVEVPKVDRGPLDNKNLVGKVLIKKERIISSLHFVTLPLRTIASMSSSFGGQGMKQCNCKKIKN